MKKDRPMSGSKAYLPHHLFGVMFLYGGILIYFSTILPWLFLKGGGDSSISMGFSGWDIVNIVLGNGWVSKIAGKPLLSGNFTLTFAFLIIIAAAVYYATRDRFIVIAITVFFLFTAIIALIDIITIISVPPFNDGSSYVLGEGLILLLISSFGGIITCVTCLYLLRKKRPSGHRVA